MVVKTGRSLVAMIAVALILSACAGSKPPVPVASDEVELPHRVAVLPFANRTSCPQAADFVGKMFYNFFSSLDYADVESSRVESILKESGLYGKIISGEEVASKKLGKILGVDGIVFGEVFSFGKVFTELYPENRAGLRAHMVNCETGLTVWQHVQTIHLPMGHLPSSADSPEKTPLTAIIDYEQAADIKAVSELCAQMAATIPNPRSAAELPPRIKALAHNGAGKLFRPGDHLNVVMIGDPGHKARWDIHPLVNNLSMEEKEPGIYVGNYRVTLEDRLAQGQLVGHLGSENDLESHWVDVLGPVKMGDPTVLPRSISQDTVLREAESPYFVEQILVVQPGVKLTVDPGTEIWFQGLGLIVRGEIQAEGTPEHPIRFGGLGSSGWKGIFVEGNGGSNLFAFCVVSDAEYGLRTLDSDVTVKRSLFQENVWAIVLEGGRGQVEHTNIRTSEKAGLSAREGEILVRNCQISENGSGGVLLEAANAQFERNNILNNGEFELKILGNEGQVQAGDNWWGTQDLEEIRVVGSVQLDPVSMEPFDFAMFRD